MEVKTQPSDKGGKRNTGWKTVGRRGGGRPLGPSDGGKFYPGDWPLATTNHPHLCNSLILRTLYQ